MPTTYEERTGTEKGQLEKLVRQKFPELKSEGVTITLMFAANPDGPAVKHHGCPAAAKIKVNSLQDRAEGKSDSTITVDEAAWKDMSERQREALFFHELTHLVVKRDKDGAVKKDDCDRPKLGCKPDDYTINGFFECAEKYGSDSPEHASIVGVVREYRQLKLWDAWDRDTVVLAITDAEAG